MRSQLHLKSIAILFDILLGIKNHSIGRKTMGGGETWGEALTCGGQWLINTSLFKDGDTFALVGEDASAASRSRRLRRNMGHFLGTLKGLRIQVSFRFWQRFTGFIL
jgi:hypothetical protein